MRPKMLALSMLLFIAAFAALFFGEKRETSAYKDEIPERYMRKGFQPYVSAVDKNSPQLRRLASELTAGCDDTECRAARVYAFVQQKVSYLSDPAGFELIQKPEETLALMAGDCEDLSILVSSLLWNIGVETQLVATDTHMYSRVCGIDRIRFENVVTQEYAGSLTVSDTRTFLPADTAWAATFEGGSGRGEYTVEFSAGEPLNFYLFPDRKEFEKMTRNMDYKYYEACSAEASTGETLKCHIEKGNVIGVRTAKASVFTFKAVKSASLSADLRFEEDEGVLCIPLDAAIRGSQVLPGMGMNEDNITEKYVIDIR
ncbi:transglutaminase domain-containing protein [Geovibrio thiophilus]|uniref:Transglutaminase domain-containing protein n=1 Tax=Geovibrio thiophilus TaxID=139438 RepID=A0A3R5Y8C8_9BACT|nr:transglutaminase-like domain-containing protein [Geovibrio thiophilus]QAR34144.1 transglutaminase domain-containing protein [Geovibrio thiophilus]